MSGFTPLQFAGKTMYEKLWDLMDEATALVMEGDTSDLAKGKAIGISQALAAFAVPQYKNAKQVREAAKERWREKQKEAK